MKDIALILNTRFSFIRIFCKIIFIKKLDLPDTLNQMYTEPFCSNQKFLKKFFLFVIQLYPGIDNLLVHVLKLAQSTKYKCSLFCFFKSNKIFDSMRYQKKRTIKLPRRQLGSSVMMMRTAHCGACIGSRSLQIIDKNGQKYIIGRIF